MRHVDIPRASVTAAVERLARWWSSAPKAERFELLTKTIHGDPQAPKLGTLQLAIYLAEAEAGEIDQG